MKNLLRVATVLVVLAVIIVVTKRLLSRYAEISIRRVRRGPDASAVPDTELAPEPRLRVVTEVVVEPKASAPAAAEEVARPAEAGPETEPGPGMQAAVTVEDVDSPAQTKSMPEPEPGPAVPSLRIVESDTPTKPAGVAESPVEDLPRPLDDEFSDVLKDVPPGPIPTAASRTADSYLDEGNVYFNVGQYELAIERYTRAVDLDDELVAAYYNRANAHTRAGEYEKALADYNRTVELAPDDSDALNNRGMLNLYQSRHEAALADFDAALVIEPDDPTVVVNRGLANLHGGNIQASLDDFIRAIDLDGSDPAAWYGAGQASAELGDRKAALTNLAEAFALDSAYAEEAAGDARLSSLADDAEFLKLLRESSAS